MIDRRAVLKAGMGLGLGLPLASRAAAQDDRAARGRRRAIS